MCDICQTTADFDPVLPKSILLLVDGNSIINRSYFALAGRANLTAADNTPTGAVNVYFNMMQKYLSELKPTHVCHLFDLKGPTFRHKMYDDYKAKRSKMPDDLAVQIPILKQGLDSLGMSRYELEGYEADDLIGTLTALAEAETTTGSGHWTIYILSGDKDDFQLISDHTFIVVPGGNATKDGHLIYDKNLLFQRYQTTPEEFIYLKAIMGDPSDNIPGVKGIGEKGAIQLISQYKNLDTIYQNVNQLSAGVQKKLTESREMAYLSYELSKIQLDVPVQLELSQLKYQPNSSHTATAFFNQWGLKSQIKKWQLSEDMTFKDNVAPIQDTLPSSGIDWPSDFVLSTITIEDFQALLSDKKGNTLTFFVDIIAPLGSDNFSPSNSPHFGQIYLKIHSAHFPLGRTSPDIPAQKEKFSQTIYAFALKDWLPLMILLKQNHPSIQLIGYQMKDNFKALEYFWHQNFNLFDVEIAGYLLNQISGTSPSFLQLYEKSTSSYLPDRVESQMETIPLKKNRQLSLDDTLANTDSPLQASLENSIDPDQKSQKMWRLFLLESIYQAQLEDIKKRNLEPLCFTIEMPLLATLDDMEREGFLVDQKQLEDLEILFQAHLKSLEESIYQKAGEKFNILSPKQLSEILFQKLELPSGRKNSGGTYSTDNDELVRLEKFHPVISDLIQYRQISKLYSTYIQGLIKVIDPKDQRIHSRFSQVMTATGRLSSSDPNLQNIPIRSEMGREIRRAFGARPGYILLDADYSQIELRLLAHLSEDENLIQAFWHNQDVHQITASKIFHIPLEEVNKEQRAAAKTVNFSIIYGISDFGLAQDLNLSFKAAHEYIEEYYNQYPKVKIYLDSLKAQGYEDGFVETMFKRRRILHELKSPNRNLRMFGERAAMNTPVQGSAADIMKIAMNKIHQSLKDNQLESRLILQVHDELIIETKKEEVEIVSSLLKEAMEKAVELKVPLIAEVHCGANWYECK